MILFNFFNDISHTQVMVMCLFHLPHIDIETSTYSF
jgi:hypothetical protein